LHKKSSAADALLNLFSASIIGAAPQKENEKKQTFALLRTVFISISLDGGAAVG